jgi:L-seryl-tRNA(Ser) seleniumtransferase
VRQTLEQGAGVVLFSGDKLLGGPQAGLAVGRTGWIDAMAHHPLARALRIDAASQAALAVTLEHYAAGAGAAIPFWRMASLGYAELETRHQALLAASGAAGKVVDSGSVPGAGSAPGATIASPAILIDADADDAWHTLAAAPIPIIGRRRDGVLMVDLRSVDPGDDPAVVDALRAI